jgi:hypothetical protein
VAKPVQRTQGRPEHAEREASKPILPWPFSDKEGIDRDEAEQADREAADNEFKNKNSFRLVSETTIPIIKVGQLPINVLTE